MLEDARKKGASIFVYLIFCLLILIFVINFGPQGGQGGGCSDSGNIIVSVDGKEASQSSYQIAFSNPYNQGRGKQRTYVALESIIRKELLAQEAEKRGMRVTDDLVMDEIKKGAFFVGGQRGQIQGIFDENGFWNGNQFRNWVNMLNVTRNSYISEQQRAMLAAMMHEVLADSVQVSREEALTQYLFENNTVQYDVVAFRPEAYRDAMKLTDADVERFLTTRRAEVEARYKTDERTYKGVKPQLQLRQIFIAKLEEPKPEPPPAPDPGAGSAAAGSAAGSAAPAAGSAAPAAGSGAGSAAPPKKEEKPAAGAPKPAGAPKKDEPKKEEPKKVGMKIEEAKAKLQAARDAIAAGKQKFVDAAKQLNTDEAAKNNGGELGWRTADSPMLGEKAVSDAVKDLKPNEMTQVITTDRGAYLLIAEAKREGDLTFDQVKVEIAKELARDVWSKEAAKRAALNALDGARSGVGMNLEQLYDKEPLTPTSPNIDIQKILNDPNIPADQKQQILDMILKSQGQSGSITVESKDIPASWKAQADGAGGGSAAPAPKAPAAGSAAAPKAPAAGSAAAPKAPAAGSAAAPKAPAAGSAAAPKAPTAGSAAAPAAGSAAPASGSAAPAPATGSAAPPAGTGAPASPPAPAADVIASSDKLPDFAEVKKPFVARFGPAPRSSMMSGIGNSKEAAKALFEELQPGNLAKKVYAGEDGSYVVMQLISRSEPKIEEFEKDADRLVEELRAARGQDFVEDWLKTRCEKLAKDGKIKPNAALLREFDDKGNALPVAYKPCMSFQAR